MKNLFKKIGALLVAAVMVLSMCTAVFAADTSATTATGSITINGLTANDNTTLKVYKVVGFDEAKSDWTIEKWAASGATNTNHVVTINWETLATINPLPEPVKEISVPANQTSYTIEGLEIGAYMILATGTNTVYTVMGEAPYGYDSNNLIVPASKTIDAKASTYKVFKTLENGDQKFVKKGEEVKFDINTTFPSYANGDTNREFTITDTPTGMYIKDIKVYVGDMNNAVDSANYTLTPNNLPAAENTSVTVAFNSSYIGENNDHAGQAVKVVVTTVITSDTHYTNEATINKGSESSTVEGWSGSIKINKTDADEENPKVLKGATFQIKSGETVLKFVKKDNYYTLLTGDMTDEEKATAVTDVEATDGSVLVKGLGAGTYTIVETKAPKGYQINTNIAPVTLTKDTEATRNVETTVKDTKLGELPSTGGMGTYLFTIIGVVVMAGAAGAFFISRRRGSEE